MGFGTNESSNVSSTGSETSLPVHYILDHSLSGLFILLKEEKRMDSLDFLQNDVVKELKEKGFIYVHFA